MVDTESRGLTPSDVETFHRDGFVLKRGLFDDVVGELNTIVRTDPAISAAVYSRDDSTGASTDLALWHDLGDDLFAAVARSERIVNGLEAIYGGEMAFYHSKLTLKKPKVGGAWEWHQDFGYWYRTGFLFPHLASVFVALDPSTRENGCLEVLKGSHDLGRLEHGVVSGQVGADITYVNAAKERLDLVPVEMAPGDALFFHCNLLHASGQNRSDHSRNIFISCYNRADNPPIMDHRANSHTRFDKADEAELASYLDRPIDEERVFFAGGEAR